MIKKICIFLLVILLGGWLILALIWGWDNYYDWFLHHKGLMWTLKIIEFLLCIPLIKSSEK